MHQKGKEVENIAIITLEINGRYNVFLSPLLGFKSLTQLGVIESIKLSGLVILQNVFKSIKMKNQKYHAIHNSTNFEISIAT